MTFIKLHTILYTITNTKQPFYSVEKEIIVPIDYIITIEQDQYTLTKENFPQDKRNVLSDPSIIGNKATIITLYVRQAYKEGYYVYRVCESIDYICNKINETVDHAVL